jgi:hypothetical protein
MNNKVVLLHIASQKEYLFYRITYEALPAAQKREWQYLRDAPPEKLIQINATTPLQANSPQKKSGCNCGGKRI